MTTDNVLGVDGCRAGWVAARLAPRSGTFALSLHSTFAHLLAANAGVPHIAVDIPVGLSESFTPRRCDQQARALLNLGVPHFASEMRESAMPGTDKGRARRGSSVFPAPDRRLLPYATYAEATAFSKQNCASGLSQQCFHICKKIAEVDALITPAMQSRLFEVHPELSFLAASGSQPLQHSKRRPEGYEERRRILAMHFPTAELPPRAEIRHQVPGATARDVQPDDILDAMIAAWTALRRSQGQHQTIPAIPEHDPRGLRMEIIY